MDGRIDKAICTTIYNFERVVKGHKKSWIAAKNRGVKFVMKVAIHMEEVSPNENYPPKISRKTIFWTDSLRMYCAKLKMSHRVKLGLERAQQEGKSIGRPYGSTIDDDEYLKKYSDVVEDVFELSLRKCMLKHKVSKGTVIKLRKILSRKRYNLQKPGLS